MSAMQNGNMRMSISSLDGVSDNFCTQIGGEESSAGQPLEEQEVPVDEYCDPRNPQRISFHDVTSAAFLIKDDIERTPCPVGNCNPISNNYNLCGDCDVSNLAFHFYFLWHGFISEKGLSTIHRKVGKT